MAHEQTVWFEEASPDDAGMVVPTGRGKGGWDGSVHPVLRVDTIARSVHIAAVREVAEELTARAARLQHQARHERDRAERLQRRSGAATGRTEIDGLL